MEISEACSGCSDCYSLEYLVVREHLIQGKDQCAAS